MKKIHVYSLKDPGAITSIINFAHRHNIKVDEYSWQENCRDFYLRVPDNCRKYVEQEISSIVDYIDTTWEIS